MKVSLNDVLLQIPLFQLTFITPFPKEEIIYEQIVKDVSKEWLERPSLLLVQQREEMVKLNNREIANQLTQDPNLLAIVMCENGNIAIHQDILSLYEILQIPIIQISD